MHRKQSSWVIYPKIPVKLRVLQLFLRGVADAPSQAVDVHAESVLVAKSSPWFPYQHPHNVYIFFCAKKLLQLEKPL